MGLLFGNTKGSIISEIFELRGDLGRIKNGWAVDVALYDDHLEIKDFVPGKKQCPITLKYAQITDVAYGMKTEIISSSKSPIGRAVAGDLLFGDVGAIVGAVSGIGTKEKTVRKHYLVISYTSAADGSEKVLQFCDNRLLKGRKLFNTLKDLCGIKDAPVKEITEL